MEKNVLETSSTSANQTDKKQSGKLIERHPLEGTPFTLVNQEEKYFLALGNYRITEYKDNEDELLNLVDSIDNNMYELLFNCMAILIDKTK